MGMVAPPITASVGRGGTNNPIDVYIIQSLLDRRLPKPHSAVPTTGVADVGTTLAIQAYQAVVMNMLPPSGVVEPGSATYYSLAAHPLVEAPTLATPTGHFGEFPDSVIQAAIASHRSWKVPASVTIAQWVVESAWGASMPPGSNNPFGIKAAGSEPAVESPTREVLNGADVIITAKFRKFDTIADAFDQHGRLLATGQPYKLAMQQAGDPDAFADALTGVYATDPLYGATLKWVIRNYNLARYDQ